MAPSRTATMALAPLSLRRIAPVSRIGLRTSLNACSRASSVRALSSSSSSVAWIQRGGYGYRPRMVASTPAVRGQAFSISARLRKDADRGQTGAAPAQDVQFKQYKFEDISSTLPSSPSAASPLSTPILIDVREPAELASTGIIPTAINLPIGSAPDALFLSEDEFLTRFGFPKPTLSQDTTGKRGSDMVFYCRAGVRAKTAAQLAVQAGYDAERIGVYDGSWLDWEKKGGKVEKWEGHD